MGTPSTKTPRVTTNNQLQTAQGETPGHGRQGIKMLALLVLPYWELSQCDVCVMSPFLYFSSDKGLKFQPVLRSPKLIRPANTPYGSLSKN